MTRELRGTSFEVATLNTEGGRHHDLVTEFLATRSLDVVFLQEVNCADLVAFSELGYYCYFAPTTLVQRSGTNEARPQGVAVLSRSALRDIRRHYYFTGNRKPGELLIAGNRDPNKIQKVILSGVMPDTGIRVGTTHFTWSANGEANDDQLRDVESLLLCLSHVEEPLVWGGDMNAPRGGVIADRVSQYFLSAVPEDITSTIDPNLHCVKGLQLVVDYLFSSHHTYVDGVTAADGISDHIALIGRAGLRELVHSVLA